MIWLAAEFIITYAFLKFTEHPMAETTTKPKFCTSCGREIVPPARFCGGCGVAVDSAQQSSTGRLPTPRNWGWIVAAILIAINLFNAYAPSKRVQATAPQSSNDNLDQVGKRSVETFLAAKRLFDFSVPAADAGLVAKKQFDEYLTASAKLSQHYSQVAGRLRNLDTFGVDAAVASFVLQSAELFDSVAAYADHNSKLVAAIKFNYEVNTGFAPLLESFARGLVGDLFGKTKEILQEQQKLKAMWDQAEQMRQEVSRRSTEVDQSEARLKVDLQTRYPSAWKTS